MKKEDKYLNCSNCSNNKFRITSTSLKDFYNTMFNINIKELYQKRQKDMLFNIESGKYVNKVLKFRIVIEDNNKKIFKHRVLKAKLKCEYSTNSEYYENIYADIWDEIDKSVFEYCKKYLYKMNNIEYMQFVNKYYDFQYNYKDKEDTESV